MAEQRYVLGIHGASTKTDAVLVTMDGTLVAEESTGSLDLFRVGISQAAEVVLRLAEKWCKKASCDPSSLYGLAIGTSRAERASERNEFQNQLLELSRRQGFQFTSVIVETDVRIALEAAFASGPGVVLIVNTGSIACAKGEDDKIYRAGGGGNVLGDEGSAYTLSSDALNAALRAHDGRGPRTLLLNYALEHFTIPSIDDLIDKVSRREVDVASFFPRVLKAEEERDHIAHGVLFRGASDLADLVRVLTMKIQPKRKLPVSLLGETLEMENLYSKMVKEKILSSLPQVVIQKPKFPPPFGAVILILRPFEFKR
ncbi:MAG: BadF/BadG/BcrA/BcrD ATPase family protein [Bacteroidota bacterium]